MKSSSTVRLCRQLSRCALFALLVFGTIFCLTHSGIGQELPRLKVSDNHRFLLSDKGTPFFWLREPAWELFHRLNREETLEYLDVRAKQGFNLIQAVALAEENGLIDPNQY